MDQLNERVFVNTAHQGSNQGLIRSRSGRIVAIDTPQLPTESVGWADRASQLGDVAYLVNTDHHPDHTVGNAWFDAPVIAHRGTRDRFGFGASELDYLQGLFSVLDPDSVKYLADYVPRPPEITFETEMQLWVDDLELRLLHLPGHTINTIGVYLPEDGIIFTGDNVCEAGLPAFVDSSLQQLFDSFDVIENLDFSLLVPGHGVVTDREIVDKNRRLTSDLVREVDRRRRAGSPIEDIANEVRYEDRIHRDVPGWPDYPAELVEYYQAESIRSIYRQLDADPQLSERTAD